MSQRPPGPDERTSLAPPPAAIPGPRLSAIPQPLRASIAPKATPAVSRKSWVAAAVVVVGLMLGAGDLILGFRGIVSFIPGIALSALALPWALLVFRSEQTKGTPVRRQFGVRLFQVAMVAVLLSVLAAKWIVWWHGLKEGAQFARSYQTYTGLLVVLLVLGIVLRGGRVGRLVAASTDHPARLMAFSFTIVSLLGALLLALPMSVRNVSEISLLDSLFMSMSAVCVTGLTTVNVADTYTLEGQIILVLLMQVGGLGIMVLTAAITMLAGRRLGVKSSAVLAEMIDAESLADLRRTLVMIVGYTLVFEAIGAGLLYVQFQISSPSDFSSDAAGGLAGSESAWWAAVFHSVSAFCNGSLSNFRAGMLPFSGSIGICQTFAVLIVLGGLGFPVIHELLFRAVARLRRRRAPRVSLNSRIALATTAMLLASMALAYLVLENSASFSKLGLVERLNAAVFQSACARTSGFNVIDVGAMRPATLLLTCFAMFVGGDPGSTAGGIKTTTLAVLFAAYRGELRGRRPQLFDRAIPDAVVRRAMGVAFLSVGLLVAVVFVLLLSERHEPLALLFEAVSAFSTTGLSTGITPKLSMIGKMLLIATMLIGRVGPLTMALALSARGPLPAYELPEERVMIG